jgi:hypothetical protein
MNWITGEDAGENGTPRHSMFGRSDSQRLRP